MDAPSRAAWKSLPYLANDGNLAQLRAVLDTFLDTSSRSSPSPSSSSTPSSPRRSSCWGCLSSSSSSSSSSPSSSTTTSRDLPDGPVVETCSRDGFTALNFACLRGHVEMVRVLVVEYGADVHARSRYGVTPLHSASGQGQVEVLRFLLEEMNVKEDLEVVDDMGYAPLASAARNGHAGAVQLLLEAGADVEAMAGDGMSVLGLAVRSQSVDTVRALLQGGADPNAPTSRANNHSALHLAAMVGGVDVVRLLCHAGADVSAVTPTRMNAVLIATLTDNYDVAEELIARGCDPTLEPTHSESVCARLGATSYRSQVGQSAVNLLAARGKAELGKKWAYVHSCQRNFVTFLVPVRRPAAFASECSIARFAQHAMFEPNCCGLVFEMLSGRVHCIDYSARKKSHA